MLQLVYGNAIAKIGGKKFVAIVAMPLPKMGEKKNFAAMALLKWGYKFLAIVAMALPKMGEKKEGYEKSMKEKKKKLSCPQYFYNIFTINHT